MTPLVIAHRGASWDLPENSLAAFERAVEVGADYVEFDVRAGPGKALVCAHGPVGRETVDACSPLDEVLEALVGRVGLAVDFKDVRAVAPTMAALKAHDIPDDRLLVLSFRRGALEAARACRPPVREVLHLGRRRSAREAVGFWGVGIRDRAARRGIVTEARQLGLAPLVYTVNEAARMREVASFGVEGIVSDRPDLLRETLAGAVA